MVVYSENLVIEVRSFHVSTSPHLKMETNCFRNVLFSSYLEFSTMGKVQKPNDFDYSEGLGKL
jgi:hypothetical protein